VRIIEQLSVLLHELQVIPTQPLVAYVIENI